MSFQVYQAQGLRIFSGDTATCAAYTGNEGEISINTETKAVYVHDGLTAGGTPLTTAEAAELAGITLGQLANIELSSPTDGQALVFNETSGVWENKTVSAGSGSGSGSGTGLALNISNPADGQALVYASGQWVNQAVAASGGSNPSILFVASLDTSNGAPYYTGQVMEPWTIRHHNGDCFNTNGTFTAPRAGVYRFDYHNNHDDADGGHQHIDWLHNGVHLGYSRIYGQHSGGWENMSGHLILELAQGDTIQLRGQANMRPDGGTYSLWSGYLMHDAVGSSSGASDLISLSDVNLDSPADGDILVYDGDSQTWKNADISQKVKATGGDISSTYTDANGQNWRVHKFTSSGQFEVTGGQLELEYLIVAGGGGGYSYMAGAGGGGYRSSVSGESSGGNTSPETPLTVSSGTYQVIVGAGGAGSVNTTTSLNKGGDSSFDTVTSLGGGQQYDAYCHSDSNIRNGGSGAGGDSNQGPGSGTTGQGHGGGSGGFSGISWYTQGGGGGAGGAGESVGGQQYGGRGGEGLTSSITGTAVDYSGGGGGGCWGRYTTGYTGTARSTSAVPQSNIAYGGDVPDAPVNQGGGGAGQSSAGDAVVGSGGSGVVIVRYKI